jgi:hypothetical protein
LDAPDRPSASRRRRCPGARTSSSARREEADGIAHSAIMAVTARTYSYRWYAERFLALHFNDALDRLSFRGA